MATQSFNLVAKALQEAGLSLELTADHSLKIAPASNLNPELRELIRLNKSEMVQWLTTAAVTDPDSDPDRWCWPHSPAMNSAEIEIFLTRQSRFVSLGLELEDAEKLADKLVFRDRHLEDRKFCFECCHLALGLHCLNWRNAGIGVQQTNAKLSGAFACQLQRCPGFTKATGEDANGL
jgi:hypothetical protein